MTDKMRDDFEAYFSKKGFGANGLRYVDGRYIHAPAATQWDVWQAATLAERERCAKVCDGLVYALDNAGNHYKREATASQCAAAIRQGGDT